MDIYKFMKGFFTGNLMVGALSLLLSALLVGCGDTAKNIAEEPASTSKPSSNQCSRGTNLSTLVCPTAARVVVQLPVSAADRDISGVNSVIQYCKGSQNGCDCQIEAREVYLRDGRQRNLLVSDSCGYYGYYSAGTSKPYCIYGCSGYDGPGGTN